MNSALYCSVVRIMDASRWYESGSGFQRIARAVGSGSRRMLPRSVTSWWTSVSRAGRRIALRSPHQNRAKQRRCGSLVDDAERRLDIEVAVHPRMEYFVALVPVEAVDDERARGTGGENRARPFVVPGDVVGGG